MHDVHIDRRKNRLYLTLEGLMELDEVRVAAAEVLDNARKLRPGFGVVNDIATFRPADEEAARIIQETQVAVAKMGMGPVVRVASGVAGLQFRRTGRAAGYKARMADSVEEAEAMLDELQAA